MDALSMFEMRRQNSVFESSLCTSNVSYTGQQEFLASCPPRSIYIPKPRRSFIRGLLDLEEGEDQAYYERQRIYSFLDDIPEPLIRCRSESDIPSIMSTRPERQKTRTVPFDERSQPVTPRPRSVHTTTSTTWSSPTESLPTTASLAERSSGRRMAQARYRENLSDNRIEFVASRYAQPEVLLYAESILTGMRHSPSLSEEDANIAMDELEKLRHNGDEMSVIRTLVANRIIPHDSGPGIVCGGDRSFNILAVPSVSGQPPLAAPRPDQYYAYPFEAFTIEQRRKMDHRTLSIHSKPATSGYFPFLTIEFKSTACMGSIWVAENQAVTSGATCVNSLEHLFGSVKQDVTPAETIAFSCIMDERSASIWVTYCDRTTGRMMSFEAENYVMSRTKEVSGVRDAVRNICDWGLQIRLPKVISALEQFTPMEVDKDVLKRTGDVLGDQPSPKRINRGSYSM